MLDCDWSSDVCSSDLARVPWTRRHTGILTALCLAALCLAGAPWAALAGDARAEAEIQAQLKRWARAYEAKDMDALMAAAAPEAVVEVQGPLGLDRRAGRARIRAAYEPDLKAAQAPSLAFTSLEIAVNGRKATVEAGLLAGATLYQRRLNMPARMVANLERREGRWVILGARLRYPVLAGGLDQFVPLGE
jgi:ketosteroid isomerase-like protein